MFKPRLPSWVVALAELVALGAGGWLGWRHVAKTPVPYERSGADFVVRWTCDQGHAFEANGAPGARSCPTCGGEAYAAFTCTCTGRGCGYVATMQLRYDQNVKVEAMRWRPAGTWQSYEFPPTCPKCGKPMRPG